MGIIIINCIILLMEYKYCKILPILTFGLFFSYYLFVPVVYGALFIYFLTKKDFKNIIIALIIPTIIGFLYFVLPGFFMQKSIIDYIQMEGTIYRNIYSNFILFIPIFIIGLIKNKEDRFNLLLVLLLLLYIFIFTIAVNFMNFSSYYLFKNYFVLWIVVIYFFFKGLAYIDEKNKYFSIIYLSIYLFTIVIYTSFVEVSSINNRGFNYNEKPYMVMDIFNTNRSIIVGETKNINEKEFEMIKYFYYNMDFNKNVGIIGTAKQLWWFYGLTGYNNAVDIPIYMNLWVDNKYYDYMIYFNKSSGMKSYSEIILNNKEHIMKNNEGGILTNGNNIFTNIDNIR